MEPTLRCEGAVLSDDGFSGAMARRRLWPCRALALSPPAKRQLFFGGEDCGTRTCLRRVRFRGKRRSTKVVSREVWFRERWPAMVLSLVRFAGIEDNGERLPANGESVNTSRNKSNRRGFAQTAPS